MLINFTNHDHTTWLPEQIAAAKDFGDICEVPFPNVSPCASTDMVISQAKDRVKSIIAQNPTAVLCQGEMSLTFHVVSLLKEQGVKVVTACSERRSEDRVVDGKQQNVRYFEFIQFREY